MMDMHDAGVDVVMEDDGSVLRWRGDPEPSMAQRMEDSMRMERIPERDGTDDNSAVAILTAVFRERAHTTQGKIDADRFLEECENILGKEEVALLRVNVDDVLKEYGTSETQSVDPMFAKDD